MYVPPLDTIEDVAEWCRLAGKVYTSGAVTVTATINSNSITFHIELKHGDTWQRGQYAIPIRQLRSERVQPAVRFERLTSVMAEVVSNGASMRLSL